MGRFLKTKLQQRMVSAAILIPVTLAVIYHGGLPFLAVLLILALLALYEWLFVASKTDKPIVFSVVGLVYILSSFWCCFLIRDQFPIGFAFIFLIMIWASDIGAYVFGKTFKGPKMAATISPNKTWSGYVGALVCPGLVSIVFLFVYAFFAWRVELTSSVHALVLFAVGLVIGFVGQSGDLLVSFFKRRANLKDTGQLIPGHGGLLDRIDSMLLAAPVYLYILTEFAYDAAR